MSVCCCSMAGIAACKYCSNNQNAERPPVVRTYTTTATDQVLISGKMTNADKIRAMTDEELADLFFDRIGCDSCWVSLKCVDPAGCAKTWLDWLKQEVEE